MGTKKSRKTKVINFAKTVHIPKGVYISVKARKVTVKGPRGTVVKDFRYAKLHIYMKDHRHITIERFFGNLRQIATVRSIMKHIKNMIIGVVKGYLYKMRSVYAHFPINVVIKDEGHKVEVRNFLGQKYIRKIDMMPGVIISVSPKTKDEYLLKGNDVDMVSRAAALIQQSTTVKHKDTRKFLDGLYVSERTTIVKD